MSDFEITLIADDLAFMPKNFQPEAVWNKAQNFLTAEKPRKALPLLRQLYEFAPQEAGVVYNLGACLYEIGDYDISRHHLAEAVSLAPNEPQILKTYALVCRYCGDFQTALTTFQNLLNTGFHDVESFVAYGETLIALESFQDAVDLYQRALENYPNEVALQNGLGDSLSKVGRISEAIKHYETSNSKNPNDPETLIRLASAFQTCGQLEEARNFYEDALDIAPKFHAAEKGLRFLILNQQNLTSDELFRQHLNLSEKYNHGASGNKTFGPKQKDSDRPLRIGYVTSDFRIHVVGFNLMPLIANHDQEKYTIFLYSDVAVPDLYTEKFKALADHWRPIDKLSSSDAARLMRSDAIDILIFLAGRFDGNRPHIAAYRPAPVQVSYHDCATSGLREMDYWLTDQLLHPNDTPEQFTEKLHHLPVFYQYEVADNLPDIGAPALEKAGRITFGCLNKPEKINFSVIDVWSRILLEVQNSQLLLKYFEHYLDPAICSRIRDRFVENGVNSEQIIFETGYDIRGDHLKYLDKIDICLDPFPFNGATTTFEALSMSVPVISLWGRHFVDRVAASMSTHAGHPELAADSADEYVNIAVTLANETSRIKKYKTSIRENVLKSPLCQNQLYARSVEDAYREMWQTWCTKEG